jgi:hypothetical protein
MAWQRGTRRGRRWRLKRKKEKLFTNALQGPGTHEQEQVGITNKVEQAADGKK